MGGRAPASVHNTIIDQGRGAGAQRPIEMAVPYAAGRLGLGLYLGEAAVAGNADDDSRIRFAELCAERHGNVSAEARAHARRDETPAGGAGDHIIRDHNRGVAGVGRDDVVRRRAPVSLGHDPLRADR